MNYFTQKYGMGQYGGGSSAAGGFMQNQNQVEILLSDIYFAGLLPSRLGNPDFMRSFLTLAPRSSSSSSSSSQQQQQLPLPASFDEEQVGRFLYGWDTSGTSIRAHRRIPVSSFEESISLKLYKWRVFNKNELLGVGEINFKELNNVNNYQNATAVDRVIPIYASPSLFPPGTLHSSLPIAYVHILARRIFPLDFGVIMGAQSEGMVMMAQQQQQLQQQLQQQQPILSSPFQGQSIGLGTGQQLYGTTPSTMHSASSTGTPNSTTTTTTSITSAVGSNVPYSAEKFFTSGATPVSQQYSTA